jgi:hypothetical protein
LAGGDEVGGACVLAAELHLAESYLEGGQLVGGLSLCA